ncbi:hypothetical protein E4U02_09160 [Microbacterium paludicola]|uniref:Alanine racemase N-terminal domain-containing protein n=1 Tax=Microbacterium paludicola TaxID=300019 RepID=A0A4Y9FV56_9MICO|nr:hypothetical protein [Microbacterium paludicola]MBF0816579.1 hypothetical protein [Microbacterium paludicola]TFU32769.1 hypothetical protein E4U02_09160 [Microbacterium paludicola]
MLLDAGPGCPGLDAGDEQLRSPSAGEGTSVWGFTVATPRQAMTLASWGAPRILHANLLVDPAAIAWVAETALVDDPAFRYLCQAGSVAAVELLDPELSRLRPSRRLDVLVELGYSGGRTGARSVSDARAVAEAITATSTLQWAGVTAYEGLVGGEIDEDRYPIGAVHLLRGVRETVEWGLAAGRFADVPIVSAGGSAYPDLVARDLGEGSGWSAPVTVVLRAGCAHIHDHGLYDRISPFGSVRGGGELRAALELRARVLSAPEPGRLILGFGRREVPTDDRLPVVLGVLDAPGASTSGWTV